MGNLLTDERSTEIHTMKILSIITFVLLTLTSCTKDCACDEIKDKRANTEIVGTAIHQSFEVYVKDCNDDLAWHTVDELTFEHTNRGVTCNTILVLVYKLFRSI